MKDADEELKDEIRRIRLQIILGISQLQNILDTRKAAKLDLGKELKAWIKNLGDLYNYAITFLGPKPKKGIGKGKSAMKLARIMKYQGIDEKQMQQAINDLGIKAYYWVGLKIVDWLTPTEQDQETLI
jgi:hypothetical protein